MIYNIKKTITVLTMVIFGGYIISSCEPEPDSMGEQLFLDDAANGNETLFDLIAYNIINNDSIQSDASQLKYAALGAFKEGQFGKQKASYFTQVRLNTYDPDFGANAIVDSVVLVVKPDYEAASDSVKITTKEDFIYPLDSIPAKKVVNTYPIKKFGKTKLNGGKMTIKVQEVTEFLNGYNDKAYSNKDYAVSSTILGSKEIFGNVSSVAINKDADNSSLFSSEPGVRIKLNPVFFQNKIIDKKGQAELKDVSNFIRHFRGLKISVQEEDGYLMQIAPNDMQLIMYYKNDKVDGSTTTRPQSTFAFNIRGGNAHMSHIHFDRSDSQINNVGTPNLENGDAKLYTQGMGGNSIGIKFKPSEIDKLKKLYQDNKSAIISAKIRLYTDPIAWNNGYSKPKILTIVQHGVKNVLAKKGYTQDMIQLTSPLALSYMTAYDLDKNPAYYDFVVTQSLKDIVESGEGYDNKFFKIDLAEFLKGSDGVTPLGYQYTSRVYSTSRAVFVGSDPTNEKQIKLRVTLSSK
ncbi:DUF4270 family protein [Chryseobacterium sp.]|uniref:DUF4270 family protein n=1 Tax=Chryseobacterium sp. TaxID=1871047 RepID=UPI00388EFB50